MQIAIVLHFQGSQKIVQKIGKITDFLEETG